MSRKKQQTYGEMVRLMAKMQNEMQKEKQRMADVMASALLDSSAAVKLGDYGDADLRRIMAMLSVHIDDCIRQLDLEKQAKKDKAKTANVTPKTDVPANTETKGYPFFIQR